MTPNADGITVLSGATLEERDQRLTDGVDALTTGGSEGSVVRQRQFLLAVAGILMTLGLSVILLGWLGAARATIVEKQIPYLISGGLFGVGLTIIGALTFFSHWFVTGIRENRAHEAARRRDHVELMAALSDLTDALGEKGGSRNGTTRSTQSGRAVRRTSSRG